MVVIYNTSATVHKSRGIALFAPHWVKILEPADLQSVQPFRVIEELILKMVRENRSRGYRRIRGSNQYPRTPRRTPEILPLRGRKP